jgi:hypothetical protein
MRADSVMPGAGSDWIDESEIERKLFNEFIERTAKETNTRIAWRIGTYGVSRLFESS